MDRVEGNEASIHGDDFAYEESGREHEMAMDRADNKMLAPRKGMLEKGYHPPKVDNPPMNPPHGSSINVDNEDIQTIEATSKPVEVTKRYVSVRVGGTLIEDHAMMEWMEAHPEVKIEKFNGQWFYSLNNEKLEDCPIGFDKRRDCIRVAMGRVE